MNLDQALLNAAEPVPPRVDRAQALLESIVHSPAPDPRRAVRRPRKTTIGVLAAAAAALAVVLANLGTGAAYASWTPEPAQLSAAEQQSLTDRCVTEVREEWQTSATKQVSLGEKRGDYAYLSLMTPGWSSTCFRDGKGTVRSASIFMAPVSAGRLGGQGVELQGWSQLRTAEGYCRLMAGHVGSQVVGVDITVRAGSGDRVRNVRATLKDGYFLAWYPEGRDEANTNRTSVTLRLAGGGTVADLSARELYDAPVLD